jgi:translocation and assembly module TamB
VLLGGTVWWIGSDNSLPRALELAQRWLPAGQQLEFTAAQGSLGSGGRIGRLVWRKPGLELTIEDLRLDWSLRELLRRDLRVRTLYARRVHVRQGPEQPPPERPFMMPDHITLPVKLTVPVAIAQVQIERVDASGAASVHELHDVAAGYRYNGIWHAARLQSLGYGESTAQATLQLHARELALSTRIDAALRNLTPAIPLAMQVVLNADGSIARDDASQLDIRLDARPRKGAVSSDADQGSVLATAVVHPWRAQPVQQLQLEVTDLNARAFHASAPDTALQGTASVTPDPGDEARAWQAQAQFSNAMPGAWDTGRLPLRQLTLEAGVEPTQVAIRTARIELSGGRPAGDLAIDGQISLEEPPHSTLRLTLEQLDLQALAGNLPRTALDGTVTLAPSEAESWQLRVDIGNALAGPLDAERAPLERLLAAINGRADRIDVDAVILEIGSGRLQLEGGISLATRDMDLRGELQALPLRQVHRRAAGDADALLSGTFTVQGRPQQRVTFSADLQSTLAAAGTTRSPWEIRALQTEGSWSPTRLQVDRVHLDAFQARVDGTGIDVVLPGFDSIAARVNAVAPGIELTANAAMRQQSGGGTLDLTLASAERLIAWLKDLPMIGERVPEWRAAGAARLDAEWQGGWRQWVAAFTRPIARSRLRLDVEGSTDGLRFELPGAADAPPRRIDVRRFNVDMEGSPAAATLALDADVRADASVAVLDVRLRSTQSRGTGGAARWNIAVEKFAATSTLREGESPWSLAFSDGLQAIVEAGGTRELQLTAGNATVTAPPEVADGGEPLRVSWEPMRWRRTARGALTIQSKGTVTGIQPGWLDQLLAKKEGEGPLTAAGMRTDLVLTGDWDVQMTDRVAVRAHVRRERGDLWLTEGGEPAGIERFDLEVRSMEEDVGLTLDWNSQRAGVINAGVNTRLARRDAGWRLPEDAPLSGRIQARIHDLTNWTFLAPPGWRLRGGLSADIGLGGTVQAPRLDGGIEGTQLNLRSVLDGIELHDGSLRAHLEGTRMRIEQLTFEGGTGSRAHVRGFSGNLTPPPTERGSMTATGIIDWSGVRTDGGDAQTGIVMDLEAQLQRMQVVVRNDRQLTLSGELSAALRAGLLTVRGDMRVDRAAIMLPEASAPTVGDDVTIIRNVDLKNPSAVEARQRARLEGRKPIDLDMKVDLGRDLALEGQGITTRLEGELNARTSTRPGEPVSLFGEVRTVEGRYRAWGQALDVETGVVRFNGPMGNPALELLAIRPEIEVRAGVRVTGTLLAPRVQLYSEPDLPEGEKLSWVVLGRATLVTGGEGTNLQQSALSLAAGQLAGGLGRDLGLDELGVDEGAVSIGKRISNELYLTYEAGLSGAASTLYIFYDITRRLTVRGETGEASAIDLIYTIKYD